MTVITLTTVTDERLDNYTRGQFILRAMAGRSAKINVISVTQLGVGNDFVYQPPGLPASDADIDIWEIPATSARADNTVFPPATPGGTPNKVLLAVMPNEVCTALPRFMNTSYRGIYLIGGVFRPAQVTGAVGVPAIPPPDGSPTVPIIDAIIDSSFKIDAGWTTATRPYFWVSNVKVEYTNVVAGDFLETGTDVVKSTNRTTYTYDHWCDIYMQKIIVDPGPDGFENFALPIDIRTSSQFNCHSDFIKVNSGGHRFCYFADCDLKWGYHTWYAQPADSVNFIAHPNAKTFMSNVMMRGIPSDNRIRGGGLRKPEYYVIAVNPNDPDPGIASGDFSATIFDNVHAEVYTGANPNDLDSYFKPDSDDASPYKPSFNGNIVSWPATTYTMPGSTTARRPITGTVTFTEPNPPVVTDAQVGLSKRVTTKEQLRALFESGTGPPTDIIVNVASPIAKFNNAAAGDLTNLDIVGGTGTGAWSIATGDANPLWSKLSLSVLTGQRTILRNAALDVDDNGSHVAIISYSGDGLTTPLTETVTITVTAPGARLPWLSGFTIGEDNNWTTAQTRIQRIETWLNSGNIGTSTLFNGAEGNTWAGVAGLLENKQAFIAGLLSRGTLPVISVGINDNGTNHTQIWNTNVRDADINRAGQAVQDAIVASGVTGAARRVVFRVGWEFNINSFPWAASNDTVAGHPNYKKAFNKVCRLLRVKVPTAEFDWCWQQDEKPPLVYTECYPPDEGTIDYVNICSIDVYDSGGSGPTDATPVASANNYDFWIRRLMKVANFAKLKGKKFAVPEWGSRPLFNDPPGGSDNKYFVQHMHKFLSRMMDGRNPDTNAVEAGWEIVEYDCYFRIDKFFSRTITPSNQHHTILYFVGAEIHPNTVFAGPSIHADPGYVEAPNAPLQGTWVGSDGNFATGLMTAEYKRLFGMPFSATAALVRPAARIAATAQVT